MTDGQAPDDSGDIGSDTRKSIGNQVVVSTVYKVLGELDAADGAGVLGKNTAESGTPIGVEGAVPNADGYGLSTPDDLRTAGTAELTTLSGSLTDNQPVSDLVGDGLAISSESLSAAPARPNVEDGSTSVTNATTLSFGDGFIIEGDGSGTATVEVDTRWRIGPKLLANDGDAGDDFGWAVGLAGDGGTAIVGAIRDDEPNGTRSGSAYVYANQWSQRRKLYPLDGDAEDQFGWDVAVDSDGTTAVIGAPKDEDPNGSDAGSAYIFDRGGYDWEAIAMDPLTTKLSASDGAENDYFGRSVAIDDQGNTAIVGATSTLGEGKSGAAYVFDGSGGWGDSATDVAKLVPSDGQAEDYFGRSVSVVDDGTTAIVGAPRQDGTNGDGSGAAYVFDGSSGWNGDTTEITKLRASNGGAGDNFGKAVAIDGAGKTAIVGADGASTAYVFDGSDGWESVSTETTRLTGSGNFGISVDMNESGTTAVIGSSQSTTVSVFNASSGWDDPTKATELVPPTSYTNDYFARGIKIDDSGQTVIAGSEMDDSHGTESGSSYLFYKTL